MLEKSLKFIVILSVPAFVYALSVSDFINFFKNGNVTATKTAPENSQSLQNLKVFEPKKVFAQTSEIVPINTDIVKSESNSFETDNLVDNFDSNSSENKSDNAVYTVQSGDSIYSIASYFGVSVNTIQTFNHLSSKQVHVGDVLEVPSQDVIVYTVKKGDTLAQLSKKFSVDMDDVVLYNGLVSSSNLVVGNEIIFPGGVDNTPAPTKDTKTPGGKKGTKVPNSGPSKIVLTSNGRIKGEWANGDTSHLNTSGDIAKYSSLPKYAGYYIFPTPGAVRTQKMHGNNGVDLGNKTGAPVLAAAGGTVTVAKAGGYNYGYGNYIRITHPNGTETIYGHLSRVDVSVGQTVDKGQQIGAVGSTGNSTGPHLHFEVRGAYNPWAW